jgi:Protein kinase domain
MKLHRDVLSRYDASNKAIETFQFCALFYYVEESEKMLREITKLSKQIDQPLSAFAGFDSSVWWFCNFACLLSLSFEWAASSSSSSLLLFLFFSCSKFCSSLSDQSPKQTGILLTSSFQQFLRFTPFSMCSLQASPPFLFLPVRIQGSRTMFEIRSLIGRGAHSHVYTGINKNSSELVALKVLSGGYPSECERHALATLGGSQHVVGLIDVFLVDELIVLVMDYATSDLLQYLKFHGPLPQPTVLRILRQVVQALCHAVSHGFCHRDMKLENILVSTSLDMLECDILLADWGYATRYSPGHLYTEGCGSMHYTAPEVGTLPYDGAKADIWSLGVVLYACLMGKFPFVGETTKEVQHSAAEGLPLRRPIFISHQLWSALRSMLSVDPMARPDSEELNLWLNVFENRVPRKTAARSMSPPTASVPLRFRDWVRNKFK